MYLPNVVLHNLGNHKFELHSFARATYCAVCGNLLWYVAKECSVFTARCDPHKIKLLL